MDILFLIAIPVAFLAYSYLIEKIFENDEKLDKILEILSEKKEIK